MVGLRASVRPMTVNLLMTFGLSLQRSSYSSNAPHDQCVLTLAVQAPPCDDLWSRARASLSKDCPRQGSPVPHAAVEALAGQFHMIGAGRRCPTRL
jgi:hypothetical protein